MPNAVYLSPADNVVTVTQEIPSGGSITWLSGDREETVTACQSIPLYHKAATTAIPAGTPVYKYGQPIGLALTDIPAGAHVHTQNLASKPAESGCPASAAKQNQPPSVPPTGQNPQPPVPAEGQPRQTHPAASAQAPQDHAPLSGQTPPSPQPDSRKVPTFQGYRRRDGRVGIRNHILVMAGSVCSSVAARKIAQKLPEVTYLYNPNGCAQTTADTERTLTILSGLIANGNVYGALIVGLGCETIQKERYLEAIRRLTDKPVAYIKLQECGGVEATVAEGVRILTPMVEAARACRREPCPVSDLILGLECGGSDPTSGFSANTVLGNTSDRIVDLGGTTVLSETPEAIGAEELLRQRGRTPEIGQKIYEAVKNNERMFSAMGMDVRATNPSPGNKASGITTLEEKSLGCVHKSGTRPFDAIVDYGQPVTTRGLVFMDTTAYDVASVVAKIAGGAQLVVFTTGMGTPVGSAVAPVIKMTGNGKTAALLRDLIDFDSSASIRGERSVEELGQDLLDYILRVCDGEPVRAEINGACDMAINQFASYC